MRPFQAIAAVLCVFSVGSLPTEAQSPQSAMPQNPSATTPSPTAAQRSASLRSEIKVVEALVAASPERAGLADRGAALYLLAHHYAHVGDRAKALALLKECVALGEGFDPSEARAFAPLKNNPEFRELVEQVRRSFPPVHRAQVAFTVAQKDLFPEVWEWTQRNASSSWAACTTTRSCGSRNPASSQIS